MGIFNLELGSIKDIFQGIGNLAKDIRTAITGQAPLDPTKLAELEAKVLELEQLGMQAQTKINEIEAAHTSVFVAGWRPFVGWVCGFGFAWQFVIGPFLQFILNSFGKNVTLPSLDITLLFQLLVGMLGMATLRTFEKYKGVEGNR